MWDVLPGAPNQLYLGYAFICTPGERILESLTKCLMLEERAHVQLVAKLEKGGMVELVPDLAKNSTDCVASLRVKIINA